MEIAEAIRKRKSCRAFKPDPVPQDVLREILELAQRAPSWANVQPWEFAVVSGAKLEEIRQGFAERAAAEPNPELPFPRRFPEHFLARLPAFRRAPPAEAARMRDDPELRRQRRLQSARLFGAPCVIYILTDRSYCYQGEALNAYAAFDCGLVAENIMLLAVSYGLATVPAAMSVTYPDVVRRVLGLKESQLIVLGIPIGYADPEHPQFGLYSEREPLESITSWHGFS